MPTKKQKAAAAAKKAADSRGGARKGAGRPRNPVKDLAPLGEETAALILRRLKHEKELIEIFYTCGDPRLQVHIIMKLREWAYGKPVQEVRLANQPGKKFEVNVTSARDKLIAALAR